MNMTRRALAATILAASTGMAAGLTLPSPALAGTRTPFTEAAFESAQAAGKPIIVDVTAPWCPTCKAQRPHVEATLNSAAMKDAVLLEVDFDTQKDVLRKFGVQMQSTLIAFKGRTEEGRATGITDPAAIKALMLKAV